MDPLENRSKFTRRQLATMVVLIGMFGSMLLLEGGLQVLYRVRSGHWVWSQSAWQVGFTAPVADRRQYTLRPGYADSEQGISIDNRGFRGNSSREDDSVLVVALGDSVPFGSGVRDDEAYPAQLQRLLDSTLSHHVAVVNAGVPSYNLRQSYDRLLRDVLDRLKYKSIIVTIQTANDVFLLTQYRDSWTPDVTWADLRFKNEWNRPTALATVHYLQKGVHALSGKDTRLRQDQAWPATDMLDSVRRTLQDVGRTCDSRSFETVLLPIDPFYYQSTREDLNPGLTNWKRWKTYVDLWDATIREYNALLSEIADSSDCIRFLDTRKILDQTDRDEMYVDFIHLSAAGNKLIATALQKYLREQQLINGLNARRRE